MNPRIFALSFLLGLTGLFAQTEDATPLSSAELKSVSEIYHAAQMQEAAALESFREIRAMQASRSLRITLEQARSRLQIPSPVRSPIDLSVLQLPQVDPARVVEQRQTLRDVNARIDEILTFVMQLKAQLKEDLTAADTLTLDALRAELSLQDISDELAAENEGEPFKDMTSTAVIGETSPAELAAVDAAVANQAATEAEKMAATAETKDSAAAKALAKESRDAATEASKAAVAAKSAASSPATASQESQLAATAAASSPATASQESQHTATASASSPATASQESQHAATASAKSTEAVNAAIKVAQITGNLNFVTAEEAHAAAAAASKISGSELSSPPAPATAAGTSKGGVNAKKILAGIAPGAYNFRPDKARPSRRIGGMGTGIDWIYVDSWYFLGPFPNPNRSNIDTSYPPESVIDLDATYTGDKAASLRWQFVQSSNPHVVPNNPQEYVIYYAYSEVWCDQDMDLWVMVGSDDSSRIWLNDQLIWKSVYRLKHWRLTEGLRKVSFRRGINRILCRFENGWGGTGFSFSINLSSANADVAPSSL